MTGQNNELSTNLEALLSKYYGNSLFLSSVHLKVFPPFRKFRKNFQRRWVVLNASENVLEVYIEHKEIFR